MSAPAKPWPPLIVAEHIPAAVRWRDRLLTLLAWAGFALLIDHEFQLTVAVMGALRGGGLALPSPGTLALERLLPFLAVAAGLGAVLAVFSVRTLRRRRRMLLSPDPEPLDLASQAKRAGLAEAELLAAREHRIVVVSQDGERLRVTAR